MWLIDFATSVDLPLLTDLCKSGNPRAPLEVHVGVDFNERSGGHLLSKFTLVAAAANLPEKFTIILQRSWGRVVSMRSMLTHLPYPLVSKSNGQKGTCDRRLRFMQSARRD